MATDTPTRPSRTDARRHALWLRLAMAGLAVAMALVAGAQAASNVLSRRAPQVAAGLSPLAAPAHERMALLSLELSATPEGRLRAGGAEAIGHARRAVAAEIGASDAWATLALVEGGVAPQASLPLLEHSRYLSRRSRLTQLGLIDRYAGQDNFPAALAVFNELALVSPAIIAQTMPQFVQQLANPANIDAFAAVLADRPPWASTFLMAAVAEPRTLDNLYRLRARLGDRLGDADFDIALMRALAASGEVDRAFAIYRGIGGNAAAAGGTGALDWTSRYPPFDWALHDEPGRYARTEDAATRLTFRLRPGYRGELARRLVQAGRGRALFLDISMEPPGLRDELALTATCAGSGTAGEAVPLRAGANLVPLPAAAAGCRVIEVVLSGAADSLGGGLEGSIEAIALR